MKEDNKNDLSRKEIYFSQIILLIIASSYLTFAIIYGIMSTVDPLNIQQRVVMTMFFFGLFILSLVSSKVKKNLYEISRLSAYLSLLHLIYVAYMENFSIDYVFSLIVVIVIANLIFKTDKKIKIYNSLTIVCLIIAVVLTKNMFINKIGFIITFSLLTFFSYMISKTKFSLEKELMIKSREYETIFNSNTDAIFLVEVVDGNFIYKKTNPVHAQLTGLNIDEIEGKTPVDILGEKLAKKINENYNKCVVTKDNITYEEELELPGGKKVWDTKLSPIIVKNKVVKIVGISRDITEKKAAEAQINYLAFHDSLTGLYNRTFFKEEIKRYDTKRQLPLSIIIGDVNGLKIINDAFGHQKGDELLITISKILKESCRQEDLIARWGGDEFVILLPNTSEEDTKIVYQRIKTNINELKGDTIKPSIALGYATKLKAEENISETFKKAEDWMYKQKLDESKYVHAHIITSLKKGLLKLFPEDYEHCQQLKESVKQFAKYLALSESELKDLELLAEMKDIGKVVLVQDKDLISIKKGEFKKYPVTGYQIAKLLVQLKNIAEPLLHQQENWDGTGYPHQLQGEEIPYFARIIKLLNDYQKMSKEKSLTSKDIIKELKKKAGKYYDPALVTSFCKYIS